MCKGTTFYRYTQVYGKYFCDLTKKIPLLLARIQYFLYLCAIIPYFSIIMKKLFALFFLALFATSATYAQNALNVYRNNGNVKSTALVNIKKITFEDSKLVFNTTTGIFRIPLKDVDYMLFGNVISSSVDNLTQPEVKLTFQGNLLTVKSQAEINNLYLLDMTGKMIAAQKLSATTETSLAVPTSGVFVLFLETTQGYAAHKIMLN